MTDDKEDKTLTTEQGVTDLELARLVRDLDGEKLPERDLWVGVQRRILDHPHTHQQRDKNFWMPYAVAASLVIAVAALMLNLVQLQGGTGYSTEVAGIDRMQQEYVRVRNPMIAEFDRVNDSLDERTKIELYRNLDILEQARHDLEFQVRENPDNRRMVELLMKVHEQELELLKQDFTQPTRSM